MKTVIKFILSRSSLSILLSFALCAYAQAAAGFTQAKAVAFVANGFVIAVTVTDGGSGYKTTPTVSFVGGGGSGAQAVAQLSADGTVTGIIVQNAGSGYTSTPLVEITPPDMLFIESVSMVPMLSIRKATGYKIDIQSTDNLESTNQWSTVTTVNVKTDPYVFVDTNTPNPSKRFYRAVLSSESNPNPSLLVEIPAGTFNMGSPSTEFGHESNESPLTTVVISQPFYMSKYEVTVSLYSQVALANPTAAQLTNQTPMVNVSWNEAMAFCGKYTEQEQLAGRLPTGYSYRLPTEAEWEYACRAGTNSAYCFGDDASQLSNYCWYNSMVSKAQIVGKKQPNAWGLYDMHGNITEWCYDWMDSYPGGTVTDPFGPSTVKSYKVNRGGNFAEYGYHCRSAFRGYGGIDARYSICGFRIVLSNVNPQN